MRTTALIALSLSSAATLVHAGESHEGGGGALQALLERMQKTKHDRDNSHHERRGLHEARVRPAPPDYSETGDNDSTSRNSTTSSSSSRGGRKHASTIESDRRHGKESSTASSSADDVATETESSSSKFVKSTDRPSRHHHARPSPSSSSQASESESPASRVREKSRLRSTDTPRRPASSSSSDSGSSTLEDKLRAAESGKAVTSDDVEGDEEYDSSSSSKQPAPTDKSAKKVPFGKKEDKRWVWGTQILQDDTPVASGVPAPGENANLLNSIPVNTPAATLVAPSFPPKASAASSSMTTPAAAATTPAAAARQPIANRKKTGAAPAKNPVAKRWTWGTSIIQDGDANAPPVGENANLLSSGTTIAINTPVAQLTPPSFPPLAATATTAASDPAASSDAQGEGAQAAAQVVDAASSTLSAVAADMTSPASASSIQALLAQLQAQIDALASAYAQSTAAGDNANAAAVAAALETSPAENARRWVWGPSIIQDDSPSSEVPPIGQNTNLFNSAIPVATPTGKPLAPNFAGRVGLASVAAAPAAVVPVVESPPAVVAAAGDAPVTPPVADAPVSSSSSSSVHRNRKSEADSMRSVRNQAAAMTKSSSAALEWHLANQKRKVGGMAKQHKRQ